MGVEGGGKPHPWILKFDIFPSNFSKKTIIFLVLVWVRWDFATFSPPAKIFLDTPGKSTGGPSPKKILPTPVHAHLALALPPRH